MEGRRCVIIGASPVIDIEMLKREVLPGDYVVCADGGYTYAHGAGIKADLIIGDFDSSVYPVKPDSETIKLIGCARNSFYKYKKQLRQA